MKTVASRESQATTPGAARRVNRGIALAAPAHGMPAVAQGLSSGAIGTAMGATAALTNTTGLPDKLKSGVETLSGLGMDDVRVHFNSPQPAQLQALAYTQGADIHIGPGQEKHLPHEAWHVVQQKQGRVKPTLRMRGVAINDNAGLEVEADAMGVRANQVLAPGSQHDPRKANPTAILRGARMAGASSILQRKIKFKNGPVWAAEKDIPKELNSTPRIEQIESQVRSEESYLAQKPADMKKRALEQEAPLLTPHRHLIGEIHNESSFEEALSNWGWGADKVVEHFQESTHVVDKVTVENRALARVGAFRNPYFEAKSLENLHPKTLSHLSELRAWLDELLRWSRVSGRHAAAIASGIDVATNKSQFSELQSQTNAKRKRVAELWSSLSLHAASYEAACAGDTSGKPQALARLCTAMKTQWKTIPARISRISKRPYELWSSWAETADGLRGVVTAIEGIFDEIINPWATALVDLTIDEVENTLPDADLGAEDIRQAWAIARDATDERAIAALSPVRELFMADKINKAGKPALVQVGVNHLAGLQQRGIADGKFHASYDAFVAATMSLGERPATRSVAIDEETPVQLASNGIVPVVQRAVIVDGHPGDDRCVSV